MPIYEYECQSCHSTLESWQSVKDEPLTTCPDCSGSLKKVISATSFTLKGGGWYADGYSSCKATGGASCKKTSECAAAGSASPAAASTDSKPSGCPSGTTCSAPTA